MAKDKFYVSNCKQLLFEENSLNWANPTSFLSILVLFKQFLQAKLQTSAGIKLISSE